MEKLGSFLKHPTKPPKKGAQSERAELIEYFYLNILPTWDEKKYKKLKVSYIAWKVSYLNKSELYHLKSLCDDAKRRGNSFAKCFFYQIRPEEEKVN